MNVTYVTCLYKIDSTSTETSLLKNLSFLIKSKIQLIIFTDSYYKDFVTQMIPKNSSVMLVHRELTEISLYKKIMESNPSLPENRNEEKDTLSFLTLMNCKPVFLLEATSLTTNKYIAWVDAAIAKHFPDKALFARKLRDFVLGGFTNIVVPGSNNDNAPDFSSLTDSISWRYLGTFFICHTDIIREFYDLCEESLEKFLLMGKLVWEVNVWNDVNVTKPIFTWYAANHNESLLNIPKECIQTSIEETQIALLRKEKRYEECYTLARKKIEEDGNVFSPVYEDLAVLCKILRRSNEGRLACERVLFSPVSDNLKFSMLSEIANYIRPLPFTRHIDVKFSLPYDYFPSSPSLVRYRDGYLYNVRVVNYTIEANGSYNVRDPNRIVRTRNFILELDNEFSVQREYEMGVDLSLLKPRYPMHILGLEDVRLFVDKNDNKYFFATCCETRESFVPRIVFGQFDDNGVLLFIQALDIPYSPNTACEKNWLPFVTDDNKICFIYSHFPLVIFEIVRKYDMFICQLVSRSLQTDFDDYEFRGSSCPVRYQGGWLYTIHQVLYTQPRKYYHRFIWYDASFKERRHGPLFCFEKPSIEYGLSIAIHGNELLMTYSINDGCQKLAAISLDTLDEHLQFSNYLLTNVTDKQEVDVKVEGVVERKIGKVKICLAMIVKNESKIIERCMLACLPVVDYICICDTGSSDNTVEIMENFFRVHNIPGKVVHHEWKNFGHNRTLSYQAARECFPDAQYCLLTDADMVLQVRPNFDKDSLTAGAYQFSQKNGPLFYFNTRLLGTQFNWKCVGVTHEYWDPQSERCINLQLETLYYNDLSDGGEKLNKFPRDIALLTQGLIDEPKNARYMFYLAQTYHDTSQYKDAIRWYRKRIQAGGWFEEIYYSYYRIARCKIGQQKPWGEIEQAYEDAWKYCPARMEPVYEIAKHYQDEEDYPSAMKWLKIAIKIPFPKDHVLFISEDVYTLHVWDSLGVTAFYLKEYKTGTDACMRALKSPACGGHSERIKQNMKLNLNGLKSC